MKRRRRGRRSHLQAELTLPAGAHGYVQGFLPPTCVSFFSFGIWSIKSCLGELICSQLGSRPGCCSHFSLCAASQQHKEGLKQNEFLPFQIRLQPSWCSMKKYGVQEELASRAESGSEVRLVSFLCLSAVGKAVTEKVLLQGKGV